MAYATVEDLEKRWRVLTPSEKTVAETLLTDASNMINRLVSDIADKMQDETYSQVLTAVICAMVKRSLMNNDEQLGITNHTMTAGSYNENITFSNPNGDMYLTKNEKKLLGIGQVKIGAIRPYIGGDDD